jgi:capsid assembly protease
MNQLPYIASRMFNTPVAIHPQKAEVIVSALADRMGIARVARLMEDDDYGGTPGAMSGPSRDKPQAGYDIVQGVAVVPVYGTLVQKLGTLRPYSGMSGYDGIRQNLLMALADPEVKAIFMDFDTPGGEVAGCFDLVDTIHRARGIKPIWGMANEMAYSAGMALISACDRVMVPRTGGEGSVGVVVLHMDWSAAIDEAGLKVTIITYGGLKAEGNPYQRLSKEAKGRIQNDINTMGELFVETVARNRNLSPDAVRDTQAACYLGGRCVEVGFADAVMPADEALLELVEAVAS